MNEIAAFFGNYPLLNMWCFYKDSSGFRDSVKGNIAK
ncbi:hypothetical protein T09_9957 [Trichinella sp. T9]|nr:hypothetical protein T09_9957 [Trichinella sp. T9]